MTKLNQPPEPVLTKADKQSSVWLKLKKHFEERLAEKRVRNDSLELTDAQTAALRGEIAVLKYSIALGETLDQSMEADEG